MQDPAQALILEHLTPKKDARILILEGGGGWLAGQAAQHVPDGEVRSLARDVREVLAAQQALGPIPNADASPAVFPTTRGWDLALLTIPKGRRYARTLIVAAWQALEPGGRLLLAGPTRKGAKAVIKDAQRLFGNARVLGYRSHQRVAACTRGETLPAPLPAEFQQPGVAPGCPHFIEVPRPAGKLILETHPGIFSWETLDEGTTLLLDHMEIEPGARVWDVGCGYGVIGLSAALAGAGFVALSDVNLLAVEYAYKNAVVNGLESKVEIFTANSLSPTTPRHPRTPAALHPSSPSPLPVGKGDYNLIISNPAFHQGRTVDRSMAADLINQAPEFLARGGKLVLVANRFLNYDKAMRARFAHVQRTAATNKFHVIEAKK